MLVPSGEVAETINTLPTALVVKVKHVELQCHPVAFGSHGEAIGSVETLFGKLVVDSNINLVGCPTDTRLLQEDVHVSDVNVSVQSIVGVIFSGRRNP